MQVLGVENPDTLEAANDLADCLRHQGAGA